MENQKINLKEKNVTELKALAYDLSGIVNQYQQMLNVVQSEINNRTTVANSPITGGTDAPKKLRVVEDSQDQAENKPDK